MNKQSLQIVLYSLAYGTNIMYAIILFMLGYFVETDVNLTIYGVLFIIPMGITLILSVPYVNKVLLDADNTDDLLTLQRNAIMRLALYHILTLVGVIAAMTYLYVF